ncbi:MAG: hypothetical protein IT376_22310 [Polyangiaceae bacterium]|nr:hypothetical protein [Polyangiaceae bacterium]
MPRWSARARSGAPATGAIWPFDPELAQLELGLRDLVKREAGDDEDRRVARAWLSARGLALAELGAVIFAARDATTLALALEAERAGDRDPLAVRWLGARLGYPPCCTERYLAIPIRDDAGLFDALLPAPGHPAPPESLWLVGALGLISHAPCSLECEDTLRLGRATLAALDARYAGFASVWRGLASRLHTLDADGRVSCTATDRLEVLPEPVPRVVAAAAGAAARWSADHRG